MTRQPRQAIFGAMPGGEGVRFRVWAPSARVVRLHRRPPGGQVCVSHLAPLAPSTCGFSDLTPEVAGVWEIRVGDAKAGDRYAYSVDDGDARPDPASRFQPDGVHDWSEVVDPRTFRWTDAGWRGLDPRRAVIYELHVGTFTPDGTFAAAAARLEYLHDLGVTAIELMPLADFAGRRNWGYDGVAPFAPSRAYGHPDDLRAFVNAAHTTGLAVLVDVVYNHLGPEGAYLSGFSRQFFTDRHATPWGGAVNLDGTGSEGARALLLDNALHWVDEYHADGLRLDATHSLIDSRRRHFVAELADAVHGAADPPPLLYAEDHRNLASMLELPSQGGWGLDGVWADDFHHVIRRMLAGDRHGYYADYEGTARELAATLGKGWLFTGQPSRHEGGPRGTDPARVPMRKAVICVQNHDQVGNRALGERLHHTVDAAAWRAAVAVLLTAPMTPLLFMGQEWATTAPFQFFTDFERELGRQVAEGRRREFRAFPEFATEETAARIPDPQADSTFEASKLRWDEIDRPEHARVLALHRALLALRKTHLPLQASDACQDTAGAPDDDTVVVHRGGDAGPGISVVARLRGAGRVDVAAARHAGSVLLDTETYAADPHTVRIDRAAGTIEFARPGAVVFARTSGASEGGSGGAKPPGK